MDIDFNEKFTKAYELMERTSQNLFITGNAGTGKSTLLDHFRKNTEKSIVVLAPTGVAAINVKGQTIHSFFKFKPNTTSEDIKRVKSDVYKKLDTIVIDEISMVRADLLDNIDRFMRINGKSRLAPFGGAQVIFIGDLYQLPPVLTNEEKEIFSREYESPFFFDSHVFDELNLEIVELDKIYRQSDLNFINILNAIRKNEASDNHLSQLNLRFQPHFEPSGDDLYVFLTTTNQMAFSINEYKLNQLDSETFIFKGEVEGDFDDKYLPTDNNLFIKKHAQIMFLNNDQEKRWVNGSVGKVTDIVRGKENTKDIIVELDNGNIVEVSTFTWRRYQYLIDEEKNKVVSKEVGAFTQYPLKLAWAITIHKSQGKTFDKVVIDIGRGTFAHGQIYVALSRCKSLEGIILRKRIEKRHILIDKRVAQFPDNLNRKNISQMTLEAFG